MDNNSTFVATNNEQPRVYNITADWFEALKEWYKEELLTSEERMIKRISRCDGYQQQVEMAAIQYDP